MSLGYGYAENVLYSELAPVDAAYLLASFEGFFERSLWEEALDWNTMAFWEHRRFEAGDDIPDQTLFLLQSQIEGYVGLYSKWRLGGRYLGLEQAFDATFDELERNSFLVKAKEPELLLGWESFLWAFEYDAEIGFSRMNFEQEGSDYESFNWEVDFDYRINDDLSWVSGVFGYERDYLERSGRDLSGAAIVGSSLQMSQLGFETGLDFRKSFDASEHRFSILLGDRQREDGQLGYYDRSRRSVEFRWQGDWERMRLALQADFGAYRYDHQLGDDGSREATDSWAWSLEWDRDLNDRWGIFVWLNGEEEDSNASFSSYESRGVSMGLRWLK